MFKELKKKSLLGCKLTNIQVNRAKRVKEWKYLQNLGGVLREKINLNKLITLRGLVIGVSGGGWGGVFGPWIEFSNGCQFVFYEV